MNYHPRTVHFFKLYFAKHVPGDPNRQTRIFQDIERRARNLYASVFNEKLFREQLAYFEDIDFSENIDFIDEQIPMDIIKNFLVNVATTQFDV